MPGGAANSIVQRVAGLAVVAVLAGGICYEVGYRSGVKRSRAEEDQRGLVVLTLSGYKFAEATNWPKVKSLLATELYGFTRDYECHFGVPSGTNGFVLRFQEAKLLAEGIERDMGPVNAAEQVLGVRSDSGAKENAVKNHRRGARTVDSPIH